MQAKVPMQMQNTRTKDREVILQPIADKLGKKVEELKPWEDYDPIWLDYKLRDTGGVWYSGD